MCPYREQCPFYRSNKNASDPNVRRAIDRYCTTSGEGCAHRDAKETYDTFLAVNQMPDASTTSP